MLIPSQSEQQLDILARLDAYADSIQQKIVNKILNNEEEPNEQTDDILCSD